MGGVIKIMTLHTYGTKVISCSIKRFLILPQGRMKLSDFLMMKEDQVFDPPAPGGL